MNPWYVLFGLLLLVGFLGGAFWRHRMRTLNDPDERNLAIIEMAFQTVAYGVSLGIVMARIWGWQ